MRTLNALEKQGLKSSSPNDNFVGELTALNGDVRSRREDNQTKCATIAK